MDRIKFESVVNVAAAERGCTVVEIDFNDDDNVFEVVLGKSEGVDLSDCEHVHRAVLTAFDRNVEDYALTVASQGIDAEEADSLLSEIEK